MEKEKIKQEIMQEVNKAVSYALSKYAIYTASQFFDLYLFAKPISNVEEQTDAQLFIKVMRTALLENKKDNLKINYFISEQMYANIRIINALENLIFENEDDETLYLIHTFINTADAQEMLENNYGYVNNNYISNCKPENGESEEEIDEFYEGCNRNKHKLLQEIEDDMRNLYCNAVVCKKLIGMIDINNNNTISDFFN